MDSIGSFAEDLILQDLQEVKEGKALPPALRDASPEPDSRDIRNTTVPESFMQQVLGEEYNEEPSEEEHQVLEEESAFFGTEPTEVIEEDFQSIILEVRELLKDVKGILTEMVSVGMIGTTQGGKSEDPKHKKLLKILKNRKRSKK